MTVVRYDHRGQGLSDRAPADDSLEAHVGDLVTMFHRLSIDRAAVVARYYAGPVALTFAHRYPERVSHLILQNSAANLGDAIDNSTVNVLRSLIDTNWELYTELIVFLAVGWAEPEAGARLAAQVRASTAPADLRRVFDLQHSMNVTNLLSDIRVPTLVTYYPHPLGFVDDRWSRVLAARVPGAELRVVERGEDAARAACEFVCGEDAVPEPDVRLPEGTAIILFADIVDSTALTEQLGDGVFRARASRLDAVMRAGIRECGGTPIEGKVMGDGVMAVFNSARQAIDAALRCEAAADGTGLALHLGIHAGDVLRERNNVFGGAVNIASRISALAPPGEVLVSDIVRGLARTSAGVAFEDRGDHQLKGIADPVRVFAVRPTG
jgi:class 3 adenylate cyclase